MNKIIYIVLLIILIIASFFIGYTLQDKTSSTGDNLDPKCKLEPMPGPCKAGTRGYYFDLQENICKDFIWGGCEGVRPFETLESCQESCER